MDSLSFVLISIIVFISVTLIIVIILEVLNTFRPDVKLKKVKGSEFKSRVLILTKRELEIYDALKTILKNKNLIIMPKIRLIDIVLPLGDSNEDIELNDLLTDLVVDITITDRKSGKILLTLEITDTKEEKRRAELLMKILKNADIPLILMNSKDKEDPNKLRSSIESLIA